MSSGIDALTAAQSIIWGGGRRGTDGHLKFWGGDGRGAGGLVTQVLTCGWNAGWRDAYVQFIIWGGGGRGVDSLRAVADKTEIRKILNSVWANSYDRKI